MRTKGGEFLIKDTSIEYIYTLNELNEEQKMMVQSVKEFMDKEVWPNKTRFEQKDYGFTVEIMEKLAEMGLLSVAVPEQYGGLGMDFITTLLICDYVSGCTGSLATAFGAHTGIGTLPIVLYGNDEQKEKYLPKLATGEWYGAYCLTEPNAGSDANSGTTKAVLTEDGKHYEITGQKMWISNAGFAEIFIVFARIEDDANITGFIIEKSKVSGMTFGEEEDKLGIKSSSTRQVFFDKVKIPVGNLLGERNKGFKIAMNALNVGRIKLAVGCLDAQRRTITEAIKYANDRVQFKVPISKFGAIRQKIAEIATNCFVGEAGTYRAGKDINEAILELKNQGLSSQEAELKGVEEYAIEAALLKVFCSEAIQHCTDEGIQIFGGMGFSKDALMESAWRDARITRIYEGTNEINRLLAVSMMIKKALKGQINLLEPAKQAGEELMGIPDFSIPDFSNPLDEEKHLIARLKKLGLILAGKAVETYGMKMVKHQEIILCLAEVMIQIYMAESAVLVAKKNQSNHQIAMAQVNLYQAVEKITTASKTAIISMCEGDVQKVMLMGLKRYTKYYNYPNIIQLKRQIADKLIKENQYISE